MYLNMENTVTFSTHFREFWEIFLSHAVLLIIGGAPMTLNTFILAIKSFTARNLPQNLNQSVHGLFTPTVIWRLTIAWLLSFQAAIFPKYIVYGYRRS